MSRYVLGIDIGGTNIKVGLVNASGKVIIRTNLSTRSFVRSKNALIDAIVGCIKDIIRANRLDRKDILGVGIGLPGLVDMKRGVVRFLTNIPHWKNVPLKKILERRLRIPVFIDNDANLVALGEWKFGAGRGWKNLACITLGTGIGGGLVINGELFRGEGFAAGEIGHIPLNEKGKGCNCGGHGCLERSIGNRYLLKRAKRIFKNNNISLEEITKKANNGDRRALRFWREAAVHLGNGLSGVVNLLNPECIIIGGGVANAYTFLRKTIDTTIKKRAMKVPAAMVKIVKAQLGRDAGIIGTQVLVKNALAKQ